MVTFSLKEKARICVIALRLKKNDNLNIEVS
ncbi:MAG: hypothetical protein BWY98_00820 [Tenericutes bacterium ADurb.BinA155]|jgi:hypothetical protein|nr:MAG: hypothetical protein BWY98_00820 [Tenericutes bacterium ADurb.BinA155]